MTTEIVEHACRILTAEPTHTIGATQLHRRTTAELGIAMSAHRFLEILDAHRDRVTIVRTPTGLLESWPEHDRRRYASALESTGLTQGAVVMLVGRAAIVPPGSFDDALPDDAPAACPPGDPLRATLADVHAAVSHLLCAGAASGLPDDALLRAAGELDALREAAVAIRPKPARTTAVSGSPPQA